MWYRRSDLKCSGRSGCDEALAIYRAHPETQPLDLANAIRSMAVLKQETGDRRRAIALWSEARELYASLQVDAGVKECTARLAMLAHEDALRAVPSSYNPRSKY